MGENYQFGNVVRLEVPKTYGIVVHVLTDIEAAEKNKGYNGNFGWWLEGDPKVVFMEAILNMHGGIAGLTSGHYPKPSSLYRLSDQYWDDKIQIVDPICEHEWIKHQRQHANLSEAGINLIVADQFFSMISRGTIDSLTANVPILVLLNS